MSVCQLIVASVGTARPGEPAASNALIAFVCIYIFFFACCKSRQRSEALLQKLVELHLSWTISC
jgi:hypothetical protein